LKTLGLLFAIFLSDLSFALDIGAYKERLRSHMANMLGDETTNKLLGEAPTQDQIELPVIPKVKNDAKDESYYDQKKSAIYSQGEKYEKLPLEQKRSYEVSFLEQLFEVTRNAEAKKDDVIKYVNVLEQGGSREGVYRSVVLDQVYLALEQYQEPASQALVDFVLDFSVRFLAIQYKPESLKSFNLWALKRIIVEKTLEVIDALAAKPEDVYSWYAVLSKELARDHSGIWGNNETRKNSLDLYHYKWAQTVPFQHIKSEVIVKMHKVMNHLQQK
jgi:hypothetical protein